MCKRSCVMKKKQHVMDKNRFSYRLKRDLRRNLLLWIMFLPVVIYYAVFSYAPMYGIILAFKDYRPKRGILGSPWVGIKYFEQFFSTYYFGTLIKNTLGISIYSLAVSFPLAILFAILLHYLTLGKLKKTVQMVSYAPYFISTVVICGMLQIFMDPTNGVFNTIIGLFGHEPIAFLSVKQYFKSIYVWSGVWQGIGWSAIIYISALAGVDYEMHEAAIIDGASKVQRIRYIDLPSIQPTIIMLLIMSLGGIMGVGFEKVYLLQNDLIMETSDIIATYTYRYGIVNGNYGYSTAVGLFNTIINLIVLFAANSCAKKITGEGLW